MVEFPVVFWPCLIGFLAEMVVIFHITAHHPSDLSKTGKINIRTATRTRIHKINATYLIKDCLHKPEQNVHECLSCLKWQICIVTLVSRVSALYRTFSQPFVCFLILLLSAGPAGHSRLSDGSEPKWLWQGNSHQIPWQLPQQPPLIPPRHTHKKITEWI